ncbi:MAG: 16S rRNA (cytosine(1402)-N(4))-methyltransferase RsmH [candidate division Zixibacteria bacterium]|nr:16S rRNA (cytosine(1402)-N(4))-methyltransferase RsmH [candidate division Zixibacteria bacterium]
MRRWPERSLSDEIHLPVLADKVVEQLSSCPDGFFIDATVGAGGHLKAVSKAHGKRFRYFGFDLDNSVLQRTENHLTQMGIEVELINSNFSNVTDFLQGRGISTISAILYDLGIGSFQIDDPKRGFSYLQDGPLSMSFDGSSASTAADIIESRSEKELVDLFRTYGEEPKAKILARTIKNNPERITTTGQLADILRSVVGDRRFIKTASRIFQALRIKVNDELAHIEKGLESILPLMATGGKAMVISYHSLEDGLVKRIFKKFSGKCVCPPKMPECRCGTVKLVRPVFTKPLIPDAKEIAVNRRARSAKMRIVEKIG